MNLILYGIIALFVYLTYFVIRCEYDLWKMNKCIDDIINTEERIFILEEKKRILKLKEKE